MRRGAHAGEGDGDGEEEGQGCDLLCVVTCAGADCTDLAVTVEGSFEWGRAGEVVRPRAGSPDTAFRPAGAYPQVVAFAAEGSVAAAGGSAIRFVAEERSGTGTGTVAVVGVSTGRRRGVGAMAAAVEAARVRAERLPRHLSPDAPLGGGGEPAASSVLSAHVLVPEGATHALELSGSGGASLEGAYEPKTTSYGAYRQTYALHVNIGGAPLVGSPLYFKCGARANDVESHLSDSGAAICGRTPKGSRAPQDSHR